MSTVAIVLPSCFFSTARNFGQAIGAAIAATLVSHGLGPEELGKGLAGLAGPGLDAYVAAQRSAFRLAAALGLVGAGISALRGPEVPLPPPTPPPGVGTDQGGNSSFSPRRE